MRRSFAFGIGAIALLATACADRPLQVNPPAAPGDGPPPLAYPGIDPGLGERPWPDEQALAGRIGAAIETTIRERYRAGDAKRDAHPKAHGCVQARLDVDATVPERLAKGIFAPGARYRAIVRFSNGSPDAGRADDKGDARGMAIKVLGVAGAKLLESEADATTQDFVMINHPVFFANDPRRYLSFFEALNGGFLGKLAVPFALGARGSLIAFETTRSRIANPLQARYWSMVPYQLGRGSERMAIKFSARPCRLEDAAVPEEAGPDFLRAALRATLQRADACMELLVQPRTSETQDVEDSMTEWTEADAPFYKVATLTIPRQDFDTPGQNRACEDLSFTPWHGLPEHRPLGVTNRLRKSIYERISRIRHELNAAPAREP